MSGVFLFIVLLTRHQFYDEYGKVIFSKEVEDKPGYTISSKYKVKCFCDAIVDGRLYKCNDKDKV